MYFKSPWICPKLSKVHIKGKIHEFLRKVSDGENIKSDSDSNWSPSIVWSHPSVITNLERIQNVWDVDRAGVCGDQHGGEGEEEGEGGHVSDVGGISGLSLLRVAAVNITTVTAILHSSQNL